MKTNRHSPSATLVAALSEYLQGGLKVGAAHHQLDAGDLIIDLDVRVRRRVEWRVADSLLERALGQLAAREYWPGACGDDTTKKSRWSSRSARCTKGITHVVVYERRDHYYAYPPVQEPARLVFSFCCGIHAERYKANEDVLGVLALPAGRLAEIRRIVEKREAHTRRLQDSAEKLADFFGAIAELANAHPQPCICRKCRPAAANGFPF